MNGERGPNVRSTNSESAAPLLNLSRKRTSEGWIAWSEDRIRSIRWNYAIAAVSTAMLIIVALTAGK